MTGSVRLAHYRDHPGCGVLVHCLGCQLARDYALEAVIARLNSRGLDGPSIGIKDVALHIAKPCPRCGGRSFETRPAWHRQAGDPGKPYGGF